MLYVDIPTLPEITSLVTQRSDACVSIYLPTTPLTQEIGAARIELRNLAKSAFSMLRNKDFDKRRLASLEALFEAVEHDDEQWRLQAHSLAIFATPDGLRTFRLPNRLKAMFEVSDRFHLKPLLRAVTFPNEAFVLALSEKKIRLVHVFPDLPAQDVKIKEMPKSAADAVNRASVNDRSPSGRIHGLEGQEVLLRMFCRKVDAALRPLLAGRHTPLILAATAPLAPIFRSVNSYPHLLSTGIDASPDRIKPADLADRARPILDAAYADQLAEVRQLFEARSQQGRGTTDVAQAARAATQGAIQTLLVDIDEVVPGTVDDQTGAVSFATGPSADTYGIVDEIAGRALVTGAQVLAVRKEDIPGGKSLAAILRYPV